MVTPVDHSFSKIMMSYNSKVSHGIFRDGFEDNFHFRIPDDVAKEYINGYDPDSEKAKEIIAKKLKSEKKVVSKELTKAFINFK